MHHSKAKMDWSHIYLMQILFVAGITFGSQSLNFDSKHTWAFCIARYVLYILTGLGTQAISVLVYDVVHNQRVLGADIFSKMNRNQVMMYLASLAILYLNDQKLYAQDFPLIFVAYLIVKYPEMEKKSGATINYGTGMALSFVEGYLVHILPSDGAHFVGFQDNIRTFEANQGVVFPVKRIFIIITKSMHCPPDLKEFNDKSDREDVARLEACQLNEGMSCGMFQSFEHVEKDVAGVKGRKYKNSAYKIMRGGARPVYVAAECATPIHTLYRVIKNRDLYEELTDVNVDDIVTDFISMLQTVLVKSPEFRNKCELILFDDTDPKLNLADVLLDRIRELEPNFEELINRRN